MLLIYLKRGELHSDISPQKVSHSQSTWGQIETGDYDLITWFVVSEEE
jgi:hypothetical protein